MLKKLILITLVLFTAASCSDGSKKEEKGKSAGEIVDKYVETITTAKPKAKTAAEALEKSNEEKIKAVDAEEKR